MEENTVGLSENTTSSETNEQTEVVETVESTKEATKTEEQNNQETTTQTDTETSGAESGTEEAPFMTVKYNHEEKGLTQEEARNWAQKGMHYEALYDKLDFIAAQSEITVNELVEKMIESIENEKLDELRDRYGDDEETVNDLMNIYREKQKKKYDKVISDRKSASEQQIESDNARIAAEFRALKAEHPELTEFSSLPDSVLKAVSNGMSLEHAYLKHQDAERRKVAAAQENAQKAANASTGSMSGEADTKTDAERRYLNALWG
jgi:hypothetical protein